MNISLIIGLIVGGLALKFTGWFILRRYLLFQHQSEEAVNRVFFTVTVPKEETRLKEGEAPKTWREAVGKIEAFFAALATTVKTPWWDWRWRLFGQETYSFEITAAGGEVFFCVGAPRSRREMVEKQLHAHYPDAHLEPGRPAILASGKSVAAAALAPGGKIIFPIQTYRSLEDDPLNALTNVLSKLAPDSAASIQLLVRPSMGKPAKLVAEQSPGAGKPPESFLHQVAVAAAVLPPAKPAASPVPPTPLEQQQQVALTQKGSGPVFEAQVRLIVSTPDAAGSQAQLESLLSAFGQYATEHVQLKKFSGSQTGRVVTDYLTHNFGPAPILLFNASELASLWHLPNQWTAAPNIRFLAARRLAPPTNLPSEGMVIGESVYRGVRQAVRLKEDDRRRHVFMIGKTGVGKTTLFTNMALQDIAEGRGVCFIDPLGDAIEQILSRLPQERANDVILFDAADLEKPLGLNLLDFNRPAEKDFLVAEWIEIFYKLYDPQKTGVIGPQWEHWARNAALTVMALPGGGTLIDIPRLFTDEVFRAYALSFVSDPVVKAFWQQQLAKTADFHKSEMYNYFISKFGRFMTNELMRNIIGQTKSAFNLREVMDQGKILLVNLSKGKIGESNAQLLGLVLVAKLQAAAFSRADVPEEQRQDFYLYVDEFHNFATDSFATILSEARKYRLNLNLTNQYIAQLTPNIKDAVIGNVGTLITFRLGAQDAEAVAKEMPGLSSSDLMNLDRFYTYVKLLIDGTPTAPFSMRSVPSVLPAEPAKASSVRALSQSQFGQTRAQIAAALAQRFEAREPAAALH